MVEIEGLAPEHEDKVNHPKHYQSSSGLECYEVIRAICEQYDHADAYCVGNVVKYLWRSKRKNGAEDLQKARWYLDKLIASVECVNG